MQKYGNGEFLTPDGIQQTVEDGMLDLGNDADGNRALVHGQIIQLPPNSAKRPPTMKLPKLPRYGRQTRNIPQIPISTNSTPSGHRKGVRSMFRNSLICLAIGMFPVGCGELEYESNVSSASWNIDLDDKTIGSNVYDFRWLKGKVEARPTDPNLATKRASWTSHFSTQSIDDLQDGEEYDFVFIDTFDWKLQWKNNGESGFRDFNVLYGCGETPASDEEYYAKASECDDNKKFVEDDLTVSPVVFRVRIGSDGGKTSVSVNIDFEVVQDR